MDRAALPEEPEERGRADLAAGVSALDDPEERGRARRERAEHIRRLGDAEAQGMLEALVRMIGAITNVDGCEGDALAAAGRLSQATT